MIAPQQIHEHIVVTTTPCVLPTAPDGATRDGDDGSGAEASVTTALQFTAASSSLDAVTFRADFGASSNLRIHARPSPTPCSPTNDTSDTLSGSLRVDCEVFPFERRVLARIVREPSKRAFVRVRYDSVCTRALAVSEIELAQQTAERTLRHAIDHSLATYCANRASVRMELGRAPWRLVQRHCDAINRFYTSHAGAVRFVDASFPPTAASLSGADDDDKDESAVDSADAALYALSTWHHLHDILDSDGHASWTLARSSSRAVSALQSPLPGQDSLLCALTFVALDKTHWLKQLLPTVPTQDDSVGRKDSRALHDIAAISVHLCDRGMRWTRVLVDLYVPGFPLGRGLMGVASLLDGELYPMLLQKAYAKLRGSYRAIRAVSTLSILRELTGLPWVTAYRSSSIDAEATSASARETQTALQRLLCRRPRRVHKLNSCSLRYAFVVSLGGVGRPHHCAFPILRSDATRGVVVHDVNGAVAAVAPGTESALDSGESSTERAITLSWNAFFALKPDVSMVLANHTEARRQRAMFVHPALVADSAQAPQQLVIEFVLSVAELTSVVVSTQVEQRNGGARCRHALALDAVGADYSLTRVPTDAASSSSRTPGVDDDSDLQLVIALGAGEYVLSVTVNASSTARPREGSAPKTPLVDADTTLALLFDCIDADMDGTISQSELQAFLQTHESESLAPEQLASFFTRFGRSGGEDAVQLLLLEDLRDVYQSLLAADPLASDDDVQKQQRAYEALVRSDLCHALSFAPAADAIPMDALYELRCSIHSDVPLIDVVRVPTQAAAPSRARAS